MKPKEMRKRRKALEGMRAARGEALDAYLRGEDPQDKVVPGLIPDAAELRRVTTEASRFVQQAERTARGSAARTRKMDQLILAIGRLVFVERVMAMDVLERAALTPRRLGVMADAVRPADLQTRLAQMHGESRTVAP